MLYLAHASRYHWGIVGTPSNGAIGEWQLSRVYATLGQPQIALQFAKSSLATCKKNGLSEIVHVANEGMARACTLAKDYPRARRYLSKARQQLGNLVLDKEDRETYLDPIRETELLIKKQ